MRCAHFSLYRLVPAVLVASCADPGGATSPPETSTVGFTAKAALTTAGPNVLRSPLSAGMIAVDPAAHLVAVIGFTQSLDDICTNFNPDAQSPGRTQLVSTPAGALHVNSASAEANVIVLQAPSDVVSLRDSFFCQKMSGAPVVATGTARYRFGRSDAFLLQTGPANVAVDQAVLQGVITLTSGGDARLLITLHTRFASGFVVVSDRERIVLTPL